MKKHPVFLTLLLGFVIVFAGSSVAYYNTKSYAFDEDAVIFYRDNEGISVFDYKIYYKDIEDFYNTTSKYMPRQAYSTAPHVVEPLVTPYI